MQGKNLTVKKLNLSESSGVRVFNDFGNNREKQFYQVTFVEQGPIRSGYKGAIKIKLRLNAPSDTSFVGDSGTANTIRVRLSGFEDVCSNKLSNKVVCSLELQQ